MSSIDSVQRQFEALSWHVMMKCSCMITVVGGNGSRLITLKSRLKSCLCDCNLSLCFTKTEIMWLLLK